MTYHVLGERMLQHPLGGILWEPLLLGPLRTAVEASCRARISVEEDETAMCTVTDLMGKRLFVYTSESLDHPSARPNGRRSIFDDLVPPEEETPDADT